jgi:hypothetical protein
MIKKTRKKKKKEKGQQRVEGRDTYRPKIWPEFRFCREFYRERKRERGFRERENWGESQG